MLDYTVRHRFTVRLDRANGTGWQPLSKKLHGALPGGEKAIALYLPLFAAVAAHYEAVPLAPRGLIIRRPWVRVPPASPVQVSHLRKRSFLGVGASTLPERTESAAREFNGTCNGRSSCSPDLHEWVESWCA
ncbi:SbcC/MukB-like Walker B domain-containing protein [Streptomyces mirabilis]|uniref:SbcC/MukB-like Walker B domain-containing protein n=1 Tax=Streptomyces mirabilis TaxID=68239 RepID=A0ABU3UHA3_9ACTN|nr:MULTISPECIES: SbcC/MukB-like Walker B domain-containing protein [unclassified Streptomyces]MCX4612998.1 hypothetical protein [Streptomyces mirabilis]MCX5353129.1 hypothetical protein [Streptomyces mirabilis]MDU8993296.1 SbcC/MukB-like Walker B domain-containing protein [Streptomyces mirabilis]